MAIRTDAVAVCAIIDSVLTEQEVVPFIRTASILVDTHLGSEVPAIDADLLREIETYLAAHFITLHDPRASKEEAGDTRFTFEGAASGEGLSSSRYGQTARMLDPTGNLGAIDKKDRTSFLYRVGNERDVEG